MVQPYSSLQWQKNHKRLRLGLLCWPWQNCCAFFPFPVRIAGHWAQGLVHAQLTKLCPQPLKTAYSPTILSPWLKSPTGSRTQFLKPYLKSCCTGLSCSLPLSYIHMSDFPCPSKPRGRALCPHPWYSDNGKQKKSDFASSHCTEHVLSDYSYKLGCNLDAYMSRSWVCNMS